MFNDCDALIHILCDFVYIFAESIVNILFVAFCILHLLFDPLVVIEEISHIILVVFGFWHWLFTFCEHKLPVLI